MVRCPPSKRRSNGRKPSHSHIGGDIARANAVNLNVVLAPLIAQGFRELTQRAFGCRVRWNGETALEGEEGAKVNDLSLTPWNHVATGLLRKEPDGFEIDIQNL